MRLYILLTLVVFIAITSPVSGARTDEFDVVMDAAIAANGQPPGAQRVKALDLNTYLTDGNPSTTPLVVDLRTPPEYSAGHIPGAINIYYRDLGKTSALNYLDSELAAHIAAGKKNEIIIYSNTHHIGLMVHNYLKITQGLPAKSLKNGLADWTGDTTVAPTRFIECTSFDLLGKGTAPAGCTTNNFPTTTLDPIDASGIGGEGYPTIDCITGPATSADLAEIARCMYGARFGDLSKPDFRMDSRALYDLLDDNQDGVINGAGDDSSNDPFVLSNRGTDWGAATIGDYYDKGHIPGAIGIDNSDGTNRMELRILNATDFMPTDRLVVHHCWVGVSQQYGGLWYVLLGYNLVSLDYGMNGWSDSSTVRGSIINPANWYKGNYAYDDMPNLGNLTVDKTNYAVGETVIVTWDMEPAPTMPNFAMVEFYNNNDFTTEELVALSPSTTTYSGHTIGSTEDGDSITVYVYFADDASDLHGDTGTSDVTSTTVPYTVPEFPLPAGPAILFGMFVPVYFSMRRHLLGTA